MTPIYSGMQVRIRALGPFILPVASDNSPGPFSFLDFRKPGSSGFVRWKAGDGTVDTFRGTGSNAVDFVDIAKPGGGFVRLKADPSGTNDVKVFTSAATSGRPYVDLRKQSSALLRIRANDNNEIIISELP